MAKPWKVMRFADMPASKAYGVFRAEDVAGLSSPLEPDEARCMMANCSYDEARRYAAALNGGALLEDVRANRQYYKNLVHSGMN